MKIVVAHYLCDWCRSPLATNDSENCDSDGLELCGDCGDLKAFSSAIAKGLAQGKSPKQTIQNLLKNYKETKNDLSSTTSSYDHQQ